MTSDSAALAPPAPANRRLRPIKVTSMLLLVVLVSGVVLVGPPEEVAAVRYTRYGWATSAVTSTPAVQRGRVVTVTARVKAASARTGRIVLSISDPAGRRVLRRVWKHVRFDAGATRRFKVRWVVPRNEPLGSHVVRVVVRRAGLHRKLHRNRNAATFRVTRRRAAPAPPPPPACGVSVSVRAQASFPLRVVPGRRYLVGANGVPFLVQGDSPWSLIVELERHEVEQYLQDRARRGFNTLLVELIEHHFSSNPPNNAYGVGPFTPAGNFDDPNEAYFAHADWVLRRAQELGFIVLLTPAYAGIGGGNEGWWQEMVAAGPDELRRYGRFLGRRYGGMSNIIWVQGGDFDPPQRALVDALAEGIADTDPDALQTVHTRRGTAPLDYWPSRSWLTVNNVYSSADVYTPAIAEYRRTTMPFFLLEAFYENERGITTRQLRTQAYHAMVAGSTGHIFGNNPIWHFSSGGLSPSPITWQEALSGPGSRSMDVAGRLLRSTRWWNLRPDLDDRWLVAGEQSGGDRAVAAVSCDRGFAVAYVPNARTISVDLDRLAGTTANLTWYDPTTGSARAPIRLPTTGIRHLPTPGANHDGDQDWLLVATTS